MTPDVLQALSDYGVNGLLVIAVVALWRRLEIITAKLTERYEQVITANTKALIHHASVVEADAARIREQTQSINNLTRQLANLEGVVSGRFPPCGPAPRG